MHDALDVYVHCIDIEELAVLLFALIEGLILDSPGLQVTR